MTTGKEAMFEVNLSFSVSSASSIHRLATEEYRQAAATAVLQDLRLCVCMCVRLAVSVNT